MLVIQKWLGPIICWLLEIVFLLYLSFHSFPKETDYPNVVNSYLLTFLDSHGYQRFQRLLDICSINFSWFLDVSEPKLY